MEDTVHDAVKKRQDERWNEGLAAVFTPWQREILRKKLRAAPLTKSEANEFSQRIKPKLRALTDLRDLGLLL